MILTALPPFALFFIAALLIAVIRAPVARAAIGLLTPLLAAYVIYLTGPDVSHHLMFLGYELTPWRTDRLSILFGYLFCIAAFLAVLFALHVKDTVQQVSGLVYAGSALGAVFAGDLLSLFVFWEILALSSVFLIWASRTERAFRAGLRYLVIQVLSGLLLLSGALIIAHETGSLAFNEIGLEGLAGALIFIAFGIKCAFPLLHNWLTDAYPETTPTGAVFMCAFTTKVAVYALARGYPGTEILIYIGAVMALYPIFFAVLENDLRRVLSYSMINQIGFMLCGIGIGTALAINGAVATAFNHVIYKGLLFMTLGAVLHMTGKVKGSDLGALYKTMPWTTVFCLIGTASIAAFPLFSGFVSKSMIFSAALYEGYNGLWIFLLLAAAGVFHLAEIKVPFQAFFSRDQGLRAAEPPRNMLAAMALASLLCIGIGVYPLWLYNLLPFETTYGAYDATHILTQLQLLFFAGLAFIWLYRRGWFPAAQPSTILDAEWLYRRAVPCLIAGTMSWLRPYNQVVRGFFTGNASGFIQLLTRHHGPGGILARTWPIGVMVLSVALLLGFYLILYYF